MLIRKDVSMLLSYFYRIKGEVKLLSRQLKKTYTYAILTIILMTLIMLTLYILAVIYVPIDIVYLLIGLIVMILLLTYMVVTILIKIPQRFLNKDVRIISCQNVYLDAVIIDTLSFGKNAYAIESSQCDEAHTYILKQFNFQYAKIEDTNKKCFIVPTHSIEVVHD